jgi:hypothetical protein
MPELDRPAVDPGLHRAEYPELRRQLTSAHPSPTSSPGDSRNLQG